MSLAQRLKQAREDKGFTQADLAELSGVRQQMISKLERGLSTQTTYILTLATILGVDAQWLGGIKEEPGVYKKRKSQHSQIKTVLQFLHLYCLDELEKMSTKEQVKFIEHCLNRVKKTRKKSKYIEVLEACLKEQ